MARFNKSDSERIARVVRKVEGQVDRPPTTSTFHQGVGLFVPILLLEVLRHNQKAKGYIRFPEDPTDPDNYEWVSEGVETEETVDVYPWKMEGKKAPIDWEVLCFWWGGRWYIAVPEDCLEDDEGEEEE